VSPTCATAPSPSIRSVITNSVGAALGRSTSGLPSGKVGSGVVAGVGQSAGIVGVGWLDEAADDDVAADDDGAADVEEVCLLFDPQATAASDRLATSVKEVRRRRIPATLPAPPAGSRSCTPIHSTFPAATP